MSKKSVPLDRWKCPNCGAAPQEHGKGGAEACAERFHSDCIGFLCECDDPESFLEGHGESVARACKNAVCYHCGWGTNGKKKEGTFPLPERKLEAWEKKAIAAGWIPPEGWTA